MLIDENRYAKIWGYINLNRYCFFPEGIFGLLLVSVTNKCINS